MEIEKLSSAGKSQKSKEELGEQLSTVFGDSLTILQKGAPNGDEKSSLGEDARVTFVEGVCSRSELKRVMNECSSNSQLKFNLFLSVTAVDYFDSESFSERPDERFEVVYHLLSLESLCRIRIRVPVSESEPYLPSVCDIWPGANFMEREVWDMYGIKFEGHPNLKRILMYEEFQGFPLRKDYPLQGKQPRIPLRAPEVQNTARLMTRPELVQISPRGNKEGTSNGSAVSGGRS